jgi:hypothetical protein
MQFKFHHLNLCSDNLPRLTNFYKFIFALLNSYKIFWLSQPASGRSFKPPPSGCKFG